MGKNVTIKSAEHTDGGCDDQSTFMNGEARSWRLLLKAHQDRVKSKNEPDFATTKPNSWHIQELEFEGIKKVGVNQWGKPEIIKPGKDGCRALDSGTDGGA